MVGPWPHRPLHLARSPRPANRCGSAATYCRRYARLYLAEIRDTDYRTKTFSCSRCGTDGALAITDPNTETGMTDYQLGRVEWSQHHPGAIGRLTARQQCSIPNTLTADRRQRLITPLKASTYSPFASEAAAIQSAVRTAFSAGMQNPAGSEVLVQEADGLLRLVWTFGKDTPPT